MSSNNNDLQRIEGKAVVFMCECENPYKHRRNTDDEMKISAEVNRDFSLSVGVWVCVSPLNDGPCTLNTLTHKRDRIAN